MEDGTGDQYIAPNVGAPFYSSPPRHRPMFARKFETQYQGESQDIPMYPLCDCANCSLCEDVGRKRPPMRLQTVYDRNNDYLQELADHGSEPGRPGSVYAPAIGQGMGGWGRLRAPMTHSEKESFTGMGPSVDINVGVLMWTFLFIFIVFMCVVCTRALTSIEYRIKELKKSVKAT